MGQQSLSSIIGGILIAAGIVVGAFLISNSSSIATTGNEDVLREKSVLTIEDLAEYLSVNTEDIEEIIDKEDMEKASIEEGIYDTYRYMPYLVISGEIRFLKSEIDEWLEYRSLNK
ncbi:hypothetical protein [Pradoshia sp.]